jgi:hypothetical protein
MADHSLNLNYVDGIPFPPFIDQKRMDELQEWHVLPNDVYIVTYPKSGTTWTQQIVKLIRSGGVEDGVNVKDSIPWLEKNGPDACKDISQPRYYKSHTCYGMMPGGDPGKSPAKYITVARNPKDTAVSMFHHVHAWKFFNFDGPWDWFFDQFLVGKVESGLWFDYVLEWWKHTDSDNILFLKYEDMKKDLPKAVETIASFIGYKLELQVVDSIAEQCSFQSMKENPACNYSVVPADTRWEDRQPFIRKGVVGDWKSYFTEDQNRRFDELYTKRMSGTGLGFEFE